MDKYKDIDVLIIEDDLIAQMALKQMLQEIGFLRIDCAAEVPTARKLVSKKTYQIVLLDVFLKGPATGIDFCKEISEEAQTDIIFITASIDPKTFEEIEKTSHYAVLEKPFDFEEIKVTIDNLLSEKATGNPLETDAQEILKLIFETANVGICVTDKDRKFIAVNDAYAQLYGYQKEELIGEEFSMMLPEDQRDYASKLHDDYIAERTEETAGEWTVSKKDGTLLAVWVTAGRLKSSSNQVYKVTTVTDISERKAYIQQLENELRRNELLLQQLHHRVKNNLNTTTAILYLKQQLAKEGLEKKAVVSIKHRIQLLARLNQLFLSKKEVTHVNASEIVKVVVKEITIKHGVESDLFLDESVEDFVIENNKAVSMAIVAYELLDNSFTYALDKKSASQQIGLAVKPIAEKYHLSVRDKGSGFEETQFTASTGLGFALVKNLIDKSSMQIGFDDSHFYIRITGLIT